MKRDSSLDLIRIICIYMVVNFHYCASLGAYNKGFFFYANGGWGGVGTAAFFMLSGYVLRMKYKETGNLLKFYKKRFLAIFPAFYICYAFFFLVRLVLFKQAAFPGVAPWKFIFTLTGTDAYLAFWNITTCALVGEWFTAAIVLNYLIYPLLNFLMKKSKWAVFAVLFAGFVAVTIFNPFKPVAVNATPVVCIFIFYVGMLIENYSKTLKQKKWLLIPFAAVAICLTFWEIPKYTEFPDPILGFCIFMILLIGGEYVCRGKIVRSVLSYLAGISYIVYLSHHIIMNIGIAGLSKETMSAKYKVFMYMVILVAILAYSSMQYLATKYIKKAIRRKGSNKTDEK